MPSILSSCLILLKLAMAVNDGLHTMLTNIYSVIENAMQKDNRKVNGESVQEASSAPTFQRSVSKSQILEAFNRRRENFAIYEQTDVLVSNLTPFQEITITNKDIEGKKKRSFSSKRSPCKRVVTDFHSDVESNVETPLPEKSPSNSNSQSDTSSLVSSDVEIDSGVQPCKVIDNSAQVEEAEDALCREKKSTGEPTETMEAAVGSKDETRTLKGISPIPTSRASLSSINKKSLKLDSNFIKSFHEQIKLTNESFHRATANRPNANGLSLKNIWCLTDSDSSTKKGENVSTEVHSKYATILPEDSVTTQNFLEEATRLYEDFLQNYYTEKDAHTDLRKTPKESPKIPNSNQTSSKSNRNQPAFKDNLSPIRKVSTNSTFRATASDGQSVNESSFEENSQPAARLAFHDYCSDRTDSDCTGFGYFSDDKPMSRVTATKHLNTYRVPLSLNKDNWMKMEDYDKSMNKKSFRKSSEHPARSDKNEWNKLAPSKELSIDLDCELDQSQPKNEGMLSVSNPTRDDNEQVLEASQDTRHSIGSNLSSLADYQLYDSDDDLEAVSFARVDTLAKLLQDVGATEVLNEPNVDEHESSHSSNTHLTKLVNDFSDTEISFLREFNSKNLTAAEALKSASTSNNNILDFNNVPFKDLDTEEKQLNYLDNITERYLLHCTSLYGSRQESLASIEHNLFEDFEERHKIMLDTITKAYRHELDSLTRSAGICLDDSSIEMDLKTNLDFPFIKTEATNSDKDCWNPSTSPKETAIGDLDAFGLPFFVQNKSKADDTEHVDEQNASFEVKREANCCVNEYLGLLEMDKDHSGTSTIDCSDNETSTPIKDQKLAEQNWISINLSSGSQKDFGDAASDDAKLNHCFINSTLFNKDANPCLIENGMENDHGLVCSHDAKVKDGILVPKDWRDLAAEMSKNYEMCISILNKCDDEAGNSNLIKESNCNEHNESCKGKTGIGKGETNCEREADLPRDGNHNAPYLNTMEDVTETDTNCNNNNMVSLEERESNTAFKKPNDTCSTSNIKYDDSDFVECENSSPLENKETRANSKSNELKLKVSLIGEHDDLDSENNNDEVFPTLATNYEVEVQVSNNTKVDLCPKCESDLKENPSQNSEAVRSKAILSTTNMSLANGELQDKTSLGDKSYLNKEFLSNDFDREVQVYLKCAKSKVPKNDGEGKKVIEQIPQSYYSGTRRELKSMRIGEPSTEEMFFNPGKSTPMSNIEGLRQREELESTGIYDNCVIIDNETVDATFADRHLPLEENEPNTNTPLVFEAKVLTLLQGAENELSYDVEVNNNDIQIAENSLVLDEETKNVM